jgi:hypothetical protein
LGDIFKLYRESNQSQSDLIIVFLQEIIKRIEKIEDIGKGNNEIDLPTDATLVKPMEELEMSGTILL